MKWVVGIDEVGRGPVAGPVAVCAVSILEKDYKSIKRLDFTDSKKMTSKKRDFYFKEFQQMQKSGLIKYSLVYKSNILIDKSGIIIAIKTALKEVLEKLELSPKDCTVLLDGSLYAPGQYKNQKTIIKGDQKEKIISLASIIAKVSRDQKMLLLHKKHSKYGWDKNKGYGTKEHYRAMKKFGLSALHRKTFLTKITAK